MRYIIPAIVFCSVGCSPSKYGVYFNSPKTEKNFTTQSKSEVNLLKENLFERDKSNLLASSKIIITPINDDEYVNSQNIQKNVESKTIHFNKTSLQPVSKTLKEKVSFKKEHSAEVPRWRYLRNAGVLLVGSLIFVALSSFSSFWGVLATIALLGAIVYFILWLIKK